MKATFKVCYLLCKWDFFYLFFRHLKLGRILGIISSRFILLCWLGVKNELRLCSVILSCIMKKRCSPSYCCQSSRKLFVNNQGWFKLLRSFKVPNFATNSIEILWLLAYCNLYKWTKIEVSLFKNFLRKQIKIQVFKSYSFTLLMYIVSMLYCFTTVKSISEV